MSARRNARLSTQPQSGRKGLIPDELRVPLVRERLRNGWTADDMARLVEARKAWFATNGYDYHDWRVRNRVDRGE